MAKKSTNESAAIPDSLGYEAAVEQLEELVERIESGEASLEKCLDDAEHAAKLIKHCRGILDRAEQRISVMSDADEPIMAEAEAEPESHGEAAQDLDEDDAPL